MDHTRAAGRGGRPWPQKREGPSKGAFSESELGGTKNGGQAQTCLGGGKVRRNKITRWVGLFVVVGLAGVLALPAMAAPARPWANSSGSATNWTWANGGDDNGLFGDPVLIGGDTFVFFPSNFRAESQGAGEVRTDDRIEVQIFANAGLALAQVIVTEYGDYSITGASGQVDVIATLDLTEIGGSGRSASAGLSSPQLPTASGSGNWDATAAIDLNFEVPLWTAFTLELTDELIAIAGAGTTASIEKTLAGAAVGVTIIPEPATMALVVLGLAGLSARRRRKTTA